MMSLGDLCLQASSPRIYDVGCGNGILLKYIKEAAVKCRKVWNDSDLFGVDLSSRMIKHAQQNYPMANFFHGDFMTFDPKVKFSHVVFNECFHYLLDPLGALMKAKVQLASEEGVIVISHPRGLSNVVTQRSKNRSLVPNTLPVDETLTKLATEAGLRITVIPRACDPNYLCVLSN